MSAVHALKLARAAGVRIGIEGDALTLDADAAPPSAVLDLLLEARPAPTPDDVILAREAYWKRILFTRGEQGLNRN